MPSFNRRGFMQLLSAAGVSPLLPALPTRAVATAASVSTSKALWAGIYAKSGSVTGFVNAARGMGLSNAAIQGVSARSIGVRVTVAAAANPISQIAGRGNGALPVPASAHSGNTNVPQDLMRSIKRALSVEPENATTGSDEHADALNTSETPTGPHADTP